MADIQKIKLACAKIESNADTLATLSEAKGIDPLLKSVLDALGKNLKSHIEDIKHECDEDSWL